MLAIPDFSSIVLVIRGYLGGIMKTKNKCVDCEQVGSACICQEVTNYFKENGHLMADKKQNQSKFFYFEPEMVKKIPVVQ